MIRPIYVLTYLLLLITPHASLALNPNTPLTQAVLDLWTTEQGLPAGRIHQILQTPEGYLWLATDSGLARFDGLHFTVFDSQNTKAFTDDTVMEMLRDHKGTLWLRFYKGGAIQYEGGRFVAVQDPLAAQNISFIYEDKDQKIWIGTPEALRYYENGRFVNYKDSKGTELKSVDDIAQTPDGVLWFWASGDIWMLKNNLFVKQTGPNFKSETTIEHTFFRDRSGKVWFSGTDELGYIEGDQIVPFKSNKELGDRVVSLISDAYGATWFGLRNGGLLRYQNGRLDRLTEEDGLSSNQIFSLAEDREGSIWIGTNGSGLNRLRDGKVVTFSLKQGMPDKYIQGIFEDDRGSLWFATNEKGAVRFAGGTYTMFSIPQGLPGNCVYTVNQDPSGAIWFGTAGWGVSRLENGKLQTFKQKDGLRDDAVLSFWSAKDRLLIGTVTGLTEYKDRILKPVGPAMKKAVAVIYGTKNGDIWFCSFGSALVRWSHGNFYQYGMKEGLTDNHIVTMHEDAEGNLWMGTYGEGLFRFRNEKFTNYTRKEGLYQNIVYAILEDNRNRLWMGSNKGIFSVTKKELNDLANGQIQSLHCLVIGKEDGMKTAECNNNSAWKTRDSKLWFGTTDGAVMLDPEHIPFNRLQPAVLLEQATADDRPLAETLPAGTKKLEFHFTSLSLLSASKNQFQYMLDGFDPHWSSPSTARAAYYSNLPPGDYVFRVKGSNNDGVWNETGAVLHFRIAPYFYQTWIFYIFSAAAILMILYSIYRLRLHQIRSRFQFVLEERGRISREIHDTITQDLSAIILQLEASELQFPADPESGLRSVAQAKDLARRGLGEARRLMGGLRPQVLEKSGLAPALSQMIRTMKGDHIDVKFQVSGTEKPLQANIEDQLLRISQEALTNAIKHSHASVVNIHLEFKGPAIRLKIQDNGEGFEPEKPIVTGGGFGIPGMKERAASIGGRCTIESAPGKGTTVLVEVPY